MRYAALVIALFIAGCASSVPPTAQPTGLGIRVADVVAAYPTYTKETIADPPRVQLTANDGSGTIVLLSGDEHNLTKIVIAVNFAHSKSAAPEYNIENVLRMFAPEWPTPAADIEAFLKTNPCLVAEHPESVILTHGNRTETLWCRGTLVAAAISAQ
jgi:hypothetical protein